MNANELADLIGMCGDGGYNQDAAKMLRQQQAEIEELKKEAALQRLSDFTQEADNEPVAEKTSNNGWNVSQEYMDLPIGTLLYAHPVKELTDEEINEIVWQQNLLLGNDDLRKFAKAILKKAQE